MFVCLFGLFFHRTLQILVLQGQIVTPHDPTSEPPDSQYVLFSAMVEPQLSETESRKCCIK